MLIAPLPLAANMLGGQRNIPKSILGGRDTKPLSEWAVFNSANTSTVVVFAPGSLSAGISWTPCRFPNRLDRCNLQARREFNWDLSSLDARPTSTHCHPCRSGRGRNRDLDHGSILNRECISAGRYSLRDIDRHSVG